jgi:hypothetical protein
MGVLREGGAVGHLAWAPREEKRETGPFTGLVSIANDHRA